MNSYVSIFARFIINNIVVIMSNNKKSVKDIRKDKVWEKTQECCAKFQKCLFVNVDNVTSKQICVMRKQFRAIDAVMVMGKNVS